MNTTTFLDFLRASAVRAADPAGAIGHLRLTQRARGGGDERKLREPEMRHAFALEAEAQGVVFGIEVPTERKYRFTKAAGSRRRSALHDLVLFDGLDTRPGVLIELKEAQVAVATDDEHNVIDAAAISKDLHKLFAERPLHGKCLFHILQAADRATVPALLSKYVPAVRVARAAAEAFDGFDAAADRTWFCLAILVVRDRRSVPVDRPTLMTYCCPTSEVSRRCDAIVRPDEWACGPVLGVPPGNG